LFFVTPTGYLDDARAMDCLDRDPDVLAGLAERVAHPADVF
jgi:hypothetical protein